MIIGEVNEPLNKKLKTMNLTSEEEAQKNEEEEEDGARRQEDAEMYQHIKESKKSIDVQTLDAATEVCVHLLVYLFIHFFLAPFLARDPL